MNTFEQISRLDDETIARNLPRAVNCERTFTATGLAYIAQYDARRLFLPAGYPSIHAYCVGHLKFSTDAAKKRVQAARAIRDFPALFDAVADGRLHLSAVVMLAPRLTADNVSELVATAAYRSKLEIEQILASLCPLLEPRARKVPRGTARAPSKQPWSNLRPTRGSVPRGTARAPSKNPWSLRPTRGSVRRGTARAPSKKPGSGPRPTRRRVPGGTRARRSASIRRLPLASNGRRCRRASRARSTCRRSVSARVRSCVAYAIC